MHDIFTMDKQQPPSDIPVDLEDTDDETKEIAIRIDSANRQADEKHITMEDETLKEGRITEYVDKARTGTKQKVVLIPRYARKLGDIKQDMKKRCSIPLKPSEKIIRMVESQKEQKALEAVRKMRKEMTKAFAFGCTRRLDAETSA